MIIDPKVGQRVRSIDGSCCDGHTEDTVGEIVKVESDTHILVKPDSAMFDDDNLWHCVLCLEPE